MRRTHASTAIVFVGVLLVASTARSQTAPLTLEDLFQGQSITALDKRFTNWQLVQLNLTGDAVADLSMVEVTPLEDDPLNPGLKFTAPCCVLGTEFSNNGNSSVNFRFSFDVQTASGEPLIKDNSLLVNGFIFDSGPAALINITETITDAAGGGLGGKFVQARPDDIGMEGLLPHHFDEADFAPQAFVHVEKSIEIIGPGMNDGAFLTMFEQRFSQVPEPGSGTLVLLAALIFGAIGRRRGWMER